MDEILIYGELIEIALDAGMVEAAAKLAERQRELIDNQLADIAA